MRALNSRVFWLGLLLAALVGLVIRVEIGLKSFISFDEWQHVFMASSARWADLSFELQTNAHPPLFFLLLRGIVRWGSVAFYRSISIGAGAGSIILVGLIARKILDSPILPLVCAAAFALSTDAISISIEIRSYQLMIFFVLVAFWAWLEMFLSVEAGIRYCMLFAIASSLAVLTHYSAVFFLGACAIVSAIFLRKSGLRAALALAFPCIVFAIEYFVHAGAQPMEGYLFDFYRTGTQGEPLPSFLLRNSRNFFNLFSPIQLDNEVLFSFAAVLLVVTAVRSFLKSSGTRRNVATIFAAVIVLELLVTSLIDKYPFGGMLRHQYIAGPFILIAAFAVLDAFPFASYQYAIPALILTASIANVILEGPKLIWFPGVVLGKEEFADWRSAFPNTRAVYLDHWSVIGYFIHTSEQPRTFVRRIADEAMVDEYRIPNGTKIFYDKTRILVDLSDPSVYRSFAACLRGSKVQELDYFFFSPGARRIDQDSAILEKLVRQRAAEQELVVTRVVVGQTSIAAGFKLQ